MFSSYLDTDYLDFDNYSSREEGIYSSYDAILRHEFSDYSIDDCIDTEID